MSLACLFGYHRRPSRVLADAARTVAICPDCRALIPSCLKQRPIMRTDPIELRPNRVTLRRIAAAS